METILNRNSKGVEIVRVDGKKRSAVKVRSKGCNHMTYRMNNIPFYEHPLLSWQNLDLCNGWAHDEEEIIRRINAGQKPCGTVNIYTEHDTSKEHADAVIGIGLNKETHCFVNAGKWQIYNGGWCELLYVLPLYKKLSDMFDLIEIREAYEKQGVYFTDEEWSTVFCLAHTDLKDLYWSGRLDIVHPKTDEELVITGLAFGYPIESTASLILGY